MAAKIDDDDDDDVDDDDDIINKTGHTETKRICYVFSKKNYQLLA